MSKKRTAKAWIARDASRMTHDEYVVCLGKPTIGVNGVWDDSAETRCDLSPDFAERLMPPLVPGEGPLRCEITIRIVEDK